MESGASCWHEDSGLPIFSISLRTLRLHLCSQSLANAVPSCSFLHVCIVSNCQSFQHPLHVALSSHFLGAALLFTFSCKCCSLMFFSACLHRCPRIFPVRRSCPAGIHVVFALLLLIFASSSDYDDAVFITPPFHRCFVFIDFI